MLAGEIRETTLREGEWRRLTLAIGIGLALLPATLYAQSIPGALPESTAALVRGVRHKRTRSCVPRSSEPPGKGEPSGSCLVVPVLSKRGENTQ